MQTRYCPHCGFLNYPSRNNPQPHCFVCLEPLMGEAMPMYPYIVIVKGGLLPISQKFFSEKWAMKAVHEACKIAEEGNYEMQIEVTGPYTAASCRRENV